ncbi:unnamed protein product [Allacma fusca]|uniref:Uncharacterized protein n=1 Tax=Allacma fusca TaxID=39272 RepID=A0A8J2JLI1_9HEXA|nr:unnamed protein product [Allacma fusca]
MASLEFGLEFGQEFGVTFNSTGDYGHISFGSYERLSQETAHGSNAPLQDRTTQGWHGREKLLQSIGQIFSHSSGESNTVKPYFMRPLQVFSGAKTFDDNVTFVISLI